MSRTGNREVEIERIINRICERIEQDTGLTREDVENHTFYELEEMLGIPHYSIRPAYTYVTLKCGCRVKASVSPIISDW